MVHHCQTTKIKALEGIDGVKPKVSLRVGIESGELVAGVIGTTRFSFDCWGETVNVASRMQSKGAANKIQLPRATFQAVSEVYTGEMREIQVKGKGKMETVLVASRTQTFVPGSLAPI